MSIFKWFVFLLLAMLLHTCGLTTALYSNVFPLKYNLTSTAWFSRDGQTHSQSVVTACKVVDQRGSLLVNFDITVTGERHWTRFPDGSILVLGGFDFCKWLEKPPEPTTRLTLADWWPPREYKGVLPIHDSHSYYFDNANDPARLRLYSTTGLMDDHSHRCAAPIELAARRGTSDAHHRRRVPMAFPVAVDTPTMRDPP